MDRQLFESWTLEDQVNFVNERSKMTMAQIAEEVGVPASSLSNIFSREGYRRDKGIYVKSQTTQPQKDDLRELLQYKEQILAMVLKEQQTQTPKQLSFSFLNNYDHKNKKTISFDLPEAIVDEIDAFVKSIGYKKQSVYALAIYELMQKYR